MIRTLRIVSRLDDQDRRALATYKTSQLSTGYQAALKRTYTPIYQARREPRAGITNRDDYQWCVSTKNIIPSLLLAKPDVYSCMAFALALPNRTFAAQICSKGDGYQRRLISKHCNDVLMHRDELSRSPVQR